MNRAFGKRAVWIFPVLFAGLVFCADTFGWNPLAAAAVGFALALGSAFLLMHWSERKHLAAEDFAENLLPILWSEDEGGRLTFLNRRWKEFSGLGDEGFETLGWLSAVHPLDRPETFRAWKTALGRGEPMEIEHRLRRGNDGTYRWFSHRAWPTKDKSGRIRMWSGCMCDVTDLRLAEAERDAALEARDEFLAIASHELRTPLTSLRLKAQTLLRGLDRGDPGAHSPERVRDFGAHADKQVSRLSRLIEDMLEVSRIRKGDLELMPEALSFADSVRSTVDGMRGQFRAAHCELIYREDPSAASLRVRADPVRLDQVVNNLLSNALRYGRSQPVQVEVGRDHDFALVRVSDQGIGISLENQRKIFNRFDRAISANEISGLGLGLFITQQIVQAHGGQVRVRSEPGIGSVFELRFPLLQAGKGENSQSGESSEKRPFEKPTTEQVSA